MCVSSLQAVKFEPYHDSSLVRFLLKRALRVSRVTSHTVMLYLNYIMYVCVCAGGGLSALINHSFDLMCFRLFLNG